MDLMHRTLLTALGALSVVYALVKFSLGYWKRRGILHEKPKFLWGNIKGVVSGKRHAQDALQDIYTAYKGRAPVPSIREIQQILVAIGDKGPEFVGSRDWIGTLEEFYVIDVLHQVPCKILHAKELSSDEILGELRSYFEKYQGFVAMGGLSDTASKAITGYHCSARGRIFLQVVVSQRISSFYELVN